MAAAARALEDERSEIEVRDVLLAVIHDQTTAARFAHVGVDGAPACEALNRQLASEQPPEAAAEG